MCICTVEIQGQEELVGLICLQSSWTSYQRVTDSPCVQLCTFFAIHFFYFPITIIILHCNKFYECAFNIE